MSLYAQRQRHLDPDRQGALHAKQLGELASVDGIGLGARACQMSFT
jgi:hypothetical protein